MKAATTHTHDVVALIAPVIAHTEAVSDHAEDAIDLIAHMHPI